MLKESRETTKEQARHARRFILVRCWTLCLALQTTTERPEFSLGLSEALARARPPGIPSPPPQLSGCASETTVLTAGSPEPPTAFPSPRVIDLSLLSPTAREREKTRENSFVRDLFSTEKGDRQRVVVFCATTRRRRHSRSSLSNRDHQTNQQHRGAPCVVVWWALVRGRPREERNARRNKPSSLFVVSDRARRTWRLLTDRRPDDRRREERESTTGSLFSFLPSRRAPRRPRCCTRARSHATTYAHTILTTSEQARSPAEFKHIIKRRKRN